MNKWFIRMGGWLILVLLAYFLFIKMGVFPSPATWFKAAPVVIDDTPMLVKQVRELNELISLSVQDEVVVSTLKPAPVGSRKQIISMFTPGSKAFDNLVLIVKGELQLGTKLNGLQPEQVFISGDSISIRIPAATVLQVQVNPSGTETFLEEGQWTASEVAQLKGKAQDLLVKRCEEKGLLAKANHRSLLLMENFLHTLGFKKVSVLSQ